MRSWLKDIKGMWVATYAEGAMVGTVNSIYLDPERKAVTGFMVRTGTPLAGEDQWIAIQEIRKVGVDLIFLQSEGSVNQGAVQGRKHTDFMGMAVTAKNGRALGNLTDIEVDWATLAIAGLGVANNQQVMIDPAETVFGADLILIQAGAETEPQGSPKAKESFMRTILGSDFIRQTSEAVKRVLRGSEANLPKSGEARKNPPDEAPGPGDDKDRE